MSTDTATSRPRVWRRQGETWIGPVGLFYSRRLFGIETAGGRFIGLAR